MPVPLIPRTIPAVGLKLPLQPRTVPAPGLQVLQHYRPAAIPGLHLRLQSRTASIMVAKKMENDKACRHLWGPDESVARLVLQDHLYFYVYLVSLSADIQLLQSHTRFELDNERMWWMSDPVIIWTK